jgi:hypothetical protein
LGSPPNYELYGKCITYFKNVIECRQQFNLPFHICGAAFSIYERKIIMLPNSQTEGNPGSATGAAEQPTSPTSAGQSQPLPEYVTALQSQVAELTTQLRGIQKGTDKQIGQVRGDIKRILELKEKGLDETGIQRELFLDQLMTGQNAPVQQPIGNGQQPNAVIDVESVVTSLQFQPNDPALAALKKKYASDPQGLLKAAADLRLGQLSSPNPNPATAPSLTSSTPPPPPPNIDVEALQQEQSKLMREPSKNYKRLNEIKQDLAKAGI